jgi:Xylose isomerase-like TIM barrel
MTTIGFSTGALALGDFRTGLNLVRKKRVAAIELSALRVHELPELMAALPRLDLKQFSYVAIHAPSFFDANEEHTIVEQLRELRVDYPIVLHPDTIHDFPQWAEFGNRLLLENMDRRKTDGRTTRELSAWFDRLPDAGFCFDLAHAQHFDPTMTEAFQILAQFGAKIRQVHISELDSASRHFPLSYSATLAFSEVIGRIPKQAAFIIESRIQPSEIDSELEKVRNLVSQPEPVPV